MRPIAFCFTLLSTLLICVLAALPAQAQRARVFVSVSGNDANPCTGGSPCKTFQHAHDVVLAGGEISVLDTGGYGTLIINKSISIVAIGVEASIAAASGGTAITIEAGSTDKVSLRGLTLDGANVAAIGIRDFAGQSLTVEDCVVRNMTSGGLVFDGGATKATLAVSNSYFTDNGDDGITITSGTGAVFGSIDRTGLYGNGRYGLSIWGLSGTAPLIVAVTDSVAANNTSAGFIVQSNSGLSDSNLTLTHSQATGNFIGVEASGPNATLWLAQSTVTGNGFGYTNNSGVINSYGDNYVDANGSNSGIVTSVGKL